MGQHGVNIGQFVSQFNERTKDLNGTIVPVEIKVFADRTIEFVVKSPPAAELLKQAAGIVKGSSAPKKEKAGEVTDKQMEEIAKTKMDDLNAFNLDQAKNIVKGTARSMGLEIVN